jgi:hypothetical protein
MRPTVSSSASATTRRTAFEVQKIIQRLRAEGVADRTDKPAYIGLHANTIRPYLTDVAMTNGSNVVTSAQLAYRSELEGSYILVRGAGAAGAFLFGRIKGNAGNITVVARPETSRLQRR